MNQKPSFICVFLLIIVITSFFTGCSGQKEEVKVTSNTKRTTNKEFLQPENSGTATFENESASLDVSNTSNGYFMAKYHGTASDSKLQVSIPDGTVYTYSLNPGSFETIPLTGITLPLISYGGSSMLTMFFALAILQKISEEG